MGVYIQKVWGGLYVAVTGRDEKGTAVSDTLLVSVFTRDSLLDWLTSARKNTKRNQKG